jgi:hypothetical protein
VGCSLAIHVVILWIEISRWPCWREPMEFAATIGWIAVDAGTTSAPAAQRAVAGRRDTARMVGVGGIGQLAAQQRL